MLIIFKNRLVKTDVNCYRTMSANTLFVSNYFYGSWYNNTTQYFTGSGTFSITTTKQYAVAIPISIEGPPCVQVHIDIHKSNFNLDGKAVNDDVSGMNIVCSVEGRNSTTSFTLTGTKIVRTQDNEFLCYLDPCLMADIFIGPGYIKYSSFSYNNQTSDIQHTQTTSYIEYQYPDSSSGQMIYINITQPCVTSSLDATSDWYGGWYYSGYVKSFYGSM